MGLFSTPQEDLINAVKDGEIDKIQAFKGHSEVDFNLADKKGHTPLEYAVLSAQPSSFDTLIQLGAKIEDGGKLLHLAFNDLDERKPFFTNERKFEKRNTTMINNLISQYDADMNPSSLSLLKDAVKYNDNMITESLLDRKEKTGLDINAKSVNPDTKVVDNILFTCFANDNVNVVNLLLKHNIDISSTYNIQYKDTRFSLKSDMVSVALNDNAFNCTKALIEHGMPITPILAIAAQNAIENSQKKLNDIIKDMESDSSYKGAKTFVLTGSVARGLLQQSLSDSNYKDSPRAQRAVKAVQERKDFLKDCLDKLSPEEKVFYDNFNAKIKEEDKLNNPSFTEAISDLFKAVIGKDTGENLPPTEKETISNPVIQKQSVMNNIQSMREKSKQPTVETKLTM